MAMKVQLSDFSYVDRFKKELGKALRFTLGIQVNLENGLKGEFAAQGCLCFRNHIEEVMWTPPSVRFGARNRNVLWINPVIYHIVLDALLEHPDLLKHLRTPIQELIRKKPVHEVDMTLPRIIEKEN